MLRKLLTPIFLTLFSFSAQAGIEKGDQLFTIYGSLTSSDTDDTIVGVASYGKFITDTLELQGTFLGVLAMPDVGFDTIVTGYGINANMYMPGKNPDIIPYVGAGGTLIAFESGGFSDNEFGLNLQAGIKQFISENVALQYQAQVISADTQDQTILSIGISIFLE